LNGAAHYYLAGPVLARKHSLRRAVPGSIRDPEEATTYRRRMTMPVIDTDRAAAVVAQLCQERAPATHYRIGDELGVSERFTDAETFDGVEAALKPALADGRIRRQSTLTYWPSNPRVMVPLDSFVPA
jgi:hypothetical protein